MAKRPFNEGSGPSQRQLRVGELIRRTISDILLRGDLHEPELAGVSITVGEVRTSPDLKVATVYFLPLGGVNAEAILKGLARAKGEIRRALSRETALKYTPDLRFQIDQTFDQMDATRAMLNQDRVRADLDREE